ncbi:MAG: 3-phosphoshikimate 1-carboxyvinyltransferase [Bacteroidota bacterium]
MRIRLNNFNGRLEGEIHLSPSKSESNRALIINALAGSKTKLCNLSDARDTETMQQLLSSKEQVLDVKDAGTTMRFLTSFLAIKGSGQVLTGTERMKNRPIGPLVEALREIGTTITYEGEEGYPPMRVSRLKDQLTAHLALPGNISSQYISSLMMIAPALPSGLTIQLTTEIFSKPYIELTESLMQSFGAQVVFNGNTITVEASPYVAPLEYSIEGDWSGISYWYSFIALAQPGSKLFIPTVREDSRQGDRVIRDIMQPLGVDTSFEKDGVTLEKQINSASELTLDFKNCPDLAQTVMVAASALGTTLHMTGLESLKIKETDRVAAMKAELAKLGAVLSENGENWLLTPSRNLPEEISVATYEDHRMAMAFAPLCLLMDVEIEDDSVIKKSYPGFWKQLVKQGVKIDKID